jgi:hypothetical protein
VLVAGATVAVGEASGARVAGCAVGG